MTINERIKFFRTDVLHITQKQLALKLGITQSGASYIEQLNNNVSDSTIKAICNIYNISEDWLRNGIEPMYIQQQSFSLDEFAKQHNMTELEIEIFKVYLELDPDIRDTVVEYFKSRLYNNTKYLKSEPIKIKVPEKKPTLKAIKRPSNLTKKNISSEPMTETEIDTLVENYRHQLEAEKKQKEKLLALHDESLKENKKINNL